MLRNTLAVASRMLHIKPTNHLKSFNEINFIKVKPCMSPCVKYSFCSQPPKNKNEHLKSIRYLKRNTQRLNFLKDKQKR